MTSETPPPGDLATLELFFGLKPEGATLDDYVCGAIEQLLRARYEKRIAGEVVRRNSTSAA